MPVLDAGEEGNPGVSLADADKVDVAAAGVHAGRLEVGNSDGYEPLSAPSGSAAKAARHSAMAKGEAT